MPLRSGEVVLTVTQHSHCEYWLNAFAHILGVEFGLVSCGVEFVFASCEVELGLTGLTSTSRSIRTTCAKSLALLRSSVSVLSVRPRILIIQQLADF